MSPPMTQAPSLKEALENLLKRYTDLANSGDAGFWNPEEEDEVIAARAALATFQPSGERREAIDNLINNLLAAEDDYSGSEGDARSSAWDALREARRKLDVAIDNSDLASGLVQNEAGWRDMDSAPKDGTVIFVRRDNGCSTDYMVVWWNDTHNDGYPWRSDNNAYVEDRWDEWMLPTVRSARDGGAET